MKQTRKHLIIAIDGPAGAGKSTVAREVARRFSILYIDSGAMYRAVALKALENNVDLTDEHALTEFARTLKIELRSGETGTRVFVNGEEVTSSIRSPEVTDASSKLATKKGVRALLVEQQQAMGRTSDVVMEGRDIGTIVFPDTPFKFYLDASTRERARRRKKDLDEAGYDVKLERLEAEVTERDRRDATREIAPLRKSEDATVIDTTDMTIEQVVNVLSERVEKIMSERSEKGA
jgi:cytidylate kinase